jgi:mannose-6-phosphate isomerase-like protein (cupin superfamily)
MAIARPGMRGGEGLLDRPTNSSVYRRVLGDNRPPWSDIGSAGTFAIEPETDRAGQDDEHERYVIGRFDPHYHPDADEYWLISTGRGVIELEREPHRFGPGDIICIPRGQLHDVVGIYERVEGFWFQPGAGNLHEHRTPEDAHGHVVPLLRDEDPA